MTCLSRPTAEHTHSRHAPTRHGASRMVTEVYLDEVMDDAVPYQEAELFPATPSTASEQSRPPSSAPATPASAQVRPRASSACG